MKPNTSKLDRLRWLESYSKSLYRKRKESKQYKVKVKRYTVPITGTGLTENG